MHILMTADATGGVWTYALDLARALAPHGVCVSLATMGRLPSALQEAEAARVPGLTLHPSSYALEWMDDPWADVARASDWLLALEAELRPHVVHLNGYVHGALPWCVPVLVAGHSCVLSWWRAVHGEDAPPVWDRYAREVRAGLQSAALVAAPTGAMLNALETHYGPLPPSRVIPNGRASGPCAPGQKEPIIFSAGRVWDEAKNIKTLTQAARGLPWPVAVAGDPRHPDGREEPLSDVQSLGRLSPNEVAGWMSRAAIYALPARYEPFGLSALEAAQSGCALVLGDIASLREVWGEAALFVPPDDPDALHAALCALIAGDAQRDQMAARARARATDYTPERMADGYLAAYRYLVTEDRGPRKDEGLKTPR
jgi:glycogen(starch) synthase